MAAIYKIDKYKIHANEIKRALNVVFIKKYL